jgi:O-antigen/teichoic acid export membrane protein
LETGGPPADEPRSERDSAGDRQRTFKDRPVAANVLWSVGNAVVSALAGFVTLPFLVRHLGASAYGTWTLVVASVSYLYILDFGISGAVGRLVAGCRPTEDVEGMNVVLSTAIVMLLCASLLMSAGVFAITGLFFQFYSVPVAEVDDVHRAILIFGLLTAVTWPLAIPNAVLWAYERFDLVYLIDIPLVILRTALILILLNEHVTLTALALITVLPTVAGGAVRCILAWRVEPMLRLSLGRVSGKVARDILSFGGWYNVLNISRDVAPQIPPSVIGNALGTGAVTLFAIPRQLIGYSNWIVLSATQALAPRAALLHFGERRVEERATFLLGARYSFAFSLFILGGFVCLGSAFLDIWQPYLSKDAFSLLLILAAGEVLPMSQWMTYNTIIAKGQHRYLAILGIAECLVMLPALALAAYWFSIVGMAVTFAVIGFLFRGVLQLIYGCRLLQVGLVQYAGEVLLPAALAASTPVLAFWAFDMAAQPLTWPGFFGYGAIYAAIFFCAAPMLLWPHLSARALNAWRPQT